MVSKDGTDRRFRVKESLIYKIKSDIVFSPLNIYPKYVGLSFCEIRGLFISFLSIKSVYGLLKLS